jgi:hypothetical protein
MHNNLSCLNHSLDCHRRQSRISDCPGFNMANAAAGNSLGDISSLLFTADASAAPQSRKEKHENPEPTPALANPFTAHAKMADSAFFAEAARAQVASARLLAAGKDAGEERMQAAEAMGATHDLISDPVPTDVTSNPQSTLETASSSYAEMYSTCFSGYRSTPTPHPAAAAAVFPRQAAAAAQRGPLSLWQFLRRKETRQPDSLGTHRRRSESRSRLQTLQTCGCNQRLRPSSGRYWSVVAAVAVFLYVSGAACIAAAQQAPCSSAWSTATLSVARQGLAATSLPNQGLAIFAGGGGSRFAFCD